MVIVAGLIFFIFFDWWPQLLLPLIRIVKKIRMWWWMCDGGWSHFTYRHLPPNLWDSRLTPTACQIKGRNPGDKHAIPAAIWFASCSGSQSYNTKVPGCGCYALGRRNGSQLGVRPRYICQGALINPLSLMPAGRLGTFLHIQHWTSNDKRPIPLRPFNVNRQLHWGLHSFMASLIWPIRSGLWSLRLTKPCHLDQLLGLAYAIQSDAFTSIAMASLALR